MHTKLAVGINEPTHLFDSLRAHVEERNKQLFVHIMHVNMKTFSLTQTMGAWLGALAHYLLEIMLFLLRFLACCRLFSVFVLLLWNSFTPHTRIEILAVSSYADPKSEEMKKKPHENIIK